MGKNLIAENFNKDGRRSRKQIEGQLVAWWPTALKRGC